jgi:hypothetical protein
MLLPYFYAIGSKMARRFRAPQPVLTRYTLLEIERPSLGMTSGVTPVRGRDVYEMGHASSVCDHCQDLITGIPLTLQRRIGRDVWCYGFASTTRASAPAPPSCTHETRKTPPPSRLAGA